MERVRVGVIGIGNIGRRHSTYLAAGEVENAVLGAVCDIKPAALEWTREHLPADVRRFDSIEALFEAKCVDGVILSIPHYSHPPVAQKALAAGLHVLSEKPAGVYTKQVRQMNEAAEKSGKVFGIMFDWRTRPLYQKVKELVDSGKLGPIKQNIFITTGWYRSQSYYDSGGWRATWSGEGGGILLNQAPHHLDLWQWICGLPSSVRAICNVARYHEIEVEDDVTAYVEYPNGANGVFVASTGITPGTTRWEITGDQAKVLIEEDRITMWKLDVPERQFNREYTKGFGEPGNRVSEIPYEGEPGMHQGITRDWARVIQEGGKLLSPGVEGIRSLEVSNAMYLSSWTNDTVQIPVDEDLYYQKLQEKIRSSTYQKGAGDRTLNVDASMR